MDDGNIDDDEFGIRSKTTQGTKLSRRGRSRSRNREAPNLGLFFSRLGESLDHHLKALAERNMALSFHPHGLGITLPTAVPVLLTKRSFAKPRGDEIAIHCPTFAAVAQRAGLSEGLLLHQARKVARNTIRRSLGLDKHGPITNVSRESFETLLSVSGHMLKEILDIRIFECELNNQGEEVISWDKLLKRDLIGRDERYYIEAAIYRNNVISKAAVDLDFAYSLYSGLCDTIWYRADPIRVACALSWREASALVALIRGGKEISGKFYASGNEGHVRGDVERLIQDETGWVNAGSLTLRLWADEAKERLKELSNLPSAERDPREETYCKMVISSHELSQKLER